jgi:hypothetical protein
MTTWEPVSFSRRTLLHGVSDQVSHYKEQRNFGRQKDLTLYCRIQTFLNRSKLSLWRNLLAVLTKTVLIYKCIIVSYINCSTQNHLFLKHTHLILYRPCINLQCICSPTRYTMFFYGRVYSQYLSALQCFGSHRFILRSVFQAVWADW